MKKTNPDEITQEDRDFIDDEDDVDEEDREYEEEEDEEEDDEEEDDEDEEQDEEEQEEDEEDLTTVDKDVLNPAQIIQTPEGRRFSLRERKATVRFEEEYAEDIRKLMMADIPSDEEQAAIEDDVDDDVEIVSEDEDYDSTEEEGEEDEENGEDETGVAVADAKTQPKEDTVPFKRVMPVGGRGGRGRGGRGPNKAPRTEKKKGIGMEMSVETVAAM